MTIPSPAPWARKIAPAAGVFLCSVCLLVLTVRGWSNAVLFVGCLLSAVLLAWGRLPPVPAESVRAARWFTVVMCAPVLAVLVSAVARGDAYSGQFDAPSRMVIALPIFFFALRSRLDVTYSLRWMLPIALLLLLVARLVQGQPARWPDIRMTTGFLDPLVFGYVSLTFGIMAMFAWPREAGHEGHGAERAHWSIVALAFVALAIGSYFSVRSQSRTGWLAVPLLAALWMHQFWTRASRWSLAWTAIGAVAVACVAFLFVPTIHARVMEAAGEIVNYPWDGSKPEDSPVSLRITYLRIAAAVFSVHPFGGIGLTPLLPPGSLPELSYTTPFAIETVLKSGFHNQMVSDAVRHGILAFFAGAALLITPLAICLRGLASPSAVASRNAAVGTAYFTCVFIASFSTEVVDLKYMASLYAVLAALFCGSVLAQRDPDTRDD